LLSAAIRMIRAEQASHEHRRDRERWAAPIGNQRDRAGFSRRDSQRVHPAADEGPLSGPAGRARSNARRGGLDLETACKLEAEEFAKLFGSPINRALLNVFFLQDRNKKAVAGRRRRRRAARPKIASAGVVGAGVMGQGIAAANVKRGIPVALMDANQEALARGVKGVLNEVSYNKQIKGPDVQRAVEFAPLVNGTMSDIELCHADIVIEAIVEDREAKQHLFARLEPLMADDAILCVKHVDDSDHATGRGPGAAGAVLRHSLFQPGAPDAAGRGDSRRKTSDATIATAGRLCQGLGKSPIVVNDGPGFLVNRLLLPYMNEAAALLLRRGRDQGDREGGQGVRHADGADHAVRRGRAGRGRARRPHNGRGVSRSRGAGRDGAALVNAGRLGTEGRPRVLRLRPAKIGKPPRGTDSDEVAGSSTPVSHRRRPQSSRRTS
jgi:hypothetical protein